MSQPTVKEVAFLAISGLSYPTKIPPYLIRLVKEAALKLGAKAVIVAGHTLDGKFLEREHRGQLREHLNSFHPRLKGDELDDEKEKFEQGFVAQWARQLDEFLPKLGDINWHFAVAERIHDRPIGAKILEALQRRRGDVRILGKRLKDGYYDREPKFNVQFPGFEDIRILVPHRTPWFSKNITNLVQRLADAYSPRTLSPKPSAVLVGGTGTASFLPQYGGVPTVSVPELHELIEQQSTENMVGATTITIKANGRDKPRLVIGVHNFRTAVFQSKQLAVPASLPNVERAVMTSLIPSDASMKHIVYRVNNIKRLFGRKKSFTEPQIKAALNKLKEQKMVFFSTFSNSWGIKDELRQNADITMASLYKDSRVVKHVVMSCFHGGCLKTLYFTALKVIRQLMGDADALIENGDINQGIAHRYEYNGELLPIANGVDKQELLNAGWRAIIRLGVFEDRVSVLEGRTVMDPVEVLKRCLPPYVFSMGNHDLWLFHNKQSLALQLFETTLKQLMLDNLVMLCKQYRVAATYEHIRDAVNATTRRVGESRMIDLDGVLVGVKHPHKGGTQTKSTRLQNVADYIWKRFDRYISEVAGQKKRFSVAYVANFHESVTAYITKWGQEVLGVMTPSYVHDTEFESHIDKVVEYGPAVVTMWLDTKGGLLYTETEYDTHIEPEDFAFCTSERLNSAQVMARCIKILAELKKVGLDLPWR